MHGPRDVRTRLAWVFAMTLAILLAVYAAGVYVLLRQALYRELDRQLEADFHVGEEMMENASRSGGRLRFASDAALPRAPEVLPTPKWRWLEIWSPDRQLLYGNPEDPKVARHLSSVPTAESVGPRSVDFVDGERVRMLSRPLVVLETPVIIRVLRSEEGLQHELWEYLRVLLIALPVAVVLAGLCGYVLTKPALEPLVTMAQRAQLITAERLSNRLPVENPHDEVGRLATIFNDTLSRLEQSFEHLRRFTADASHELRTPLTALRSVGEVGLRGDRTPAAYREIIGSLLEEVDRLSHVVDSLLLLSRAETGQVQLNVERVELVDLCRETCEFLAVLADDKRQTVNVASGGPVPVFADRTILRRAVVNLVDNAIKFSPQEGAITVTVGRRGQDAVVEVTDRGPGIPAADRERVFDRFYRVDPGRSRTEAQGGSGLGLSIARWAVQASGGRLVVESEEDAGSTFRITLPAVE
ncbi:MAG TPA: heavy metal sensor histidine kinase [Vicinamibacterales bacterium]